MLQSTQNFQEMISHFVQTNQMGIILQDDWDVSNAVCNFLEVFYTAIKECSGVYYLTINLSSNTHTALLIILKTIRKILYLHTLVR